MTANLFLGIDIGSTTLKMVLLSSENEVLHTLYRRTKPLANGTKKCGGQCDRCGACYLGAVSNIVDDFLAEASATRADVLRTCITGSQAVEALSDHLKLDAFVSEVSAHVAGARHAFPDCEAILDVGGQDSKAMLFDPEMDVWVSRINGVCAAGTGAFLDNVAAKLNVTVDEMTDRCNLASELELSSVCAVLSATSVNKFKNRYPLGDVLAAACRAQARTIFSSVGGVFLDYRGPVVFQGGVAANGAVAHYLRDISGSQILIPEHHRVMGALGAASLAREHLQFNGTAIKTTSLDGDFAGQPPAWSFEQEGLHSGNGTRETAKSSAGPVPRRSNSRAAQMRAQLTLSEYFSGGNGPLVWRNLFYPAEILSALDVRTVTLETYAALQARSKNKVRGCLDRAAAKGFSAETCSFLRVLEGDPNLPVPDSIVGTDAPCQQGDRIFTDLARDLGRSDRLFSLNTPANMSKRSIETIAAGLEASVWHLEKTTGMTMDPGRLYEACVLSNGARDLAMQCFDIRRSSPPLVRGSEAVSFAAIFSQMWGKQELVQLFETMLAELLERKEKVERRIGVDDTHRLLWLHLAPFYSDALLDYIELRCHAPIVFEEVNYVGWDVLDPDDPYRSLARKLLTLGFLDNQSRIERICDWAPQGNINGCILYNHMFRRCSMADSTFIRQLEERLQQINVPLLVLDGDCIDETIDPCSTFTKVSAYIESLNLKKYGNPFGPCPQQESCCVTVGADSAGSQTCSGCS